MGNELFTVYKSSAGSGKTFTLTREYLKLALQKPDQYKKSLAVTFTNKATQEMKDRIIRNLFLFSNGINDGMGSQLIKLLNLDSTTFQKSCQSLLTSILHNYSRFSVQTIDRFFQNVMRSFARELSLQGDGELLLKTDEVRNAVVDLLMEDLSTNQALRDWILEFSIDKLEQKGRWDIRKDILGFTSELMKDDFKVKEQALQLAINDYSKLKNYKSKLFKILNRYENDLDEIGKKAIHLIESKGLTLLDFSYGATSAPNLFNKIQSHTKNYDVGARVLDVLESEGQKLASKKSEKREEILQVAHDGLLDYFQQVINYKEENIKVYTSAREIIKNIYLLGITWHFNQKLQEYKTEEGIQFLSDTTQFLNDIIGTDPAESPFVYEKMGSFYEHFLMDEFQDTSTLQWQNFKPLIENSLADGNENLVVGDVKQSIYRWRGGDWRLLLKGLEEDIPSHFYQEKSLDHNYRSKPNVIDFNNDLFAQLPKIIQQYAINRKSHPFDEDFQLLLNDLTLAYKDVIQQKQSVYPFNGFVSLQFIEDDEDEEGEKISWRDFSLAKFVSDLETLQDYGVKLNQVGILIRTKKDGIELQEFLEKYKTDNPKKALQYHYNIISDETLRLSSAHIVNFLLNCFEFLYTDDTIAKAQMKFYYQKIINAEDNNTHDIVKVSEGDNFLPDDFITQQKQLLSLNLLEMSERLIQLFQLKNIKEEKAYLSAFQDVLLDFGNKGGIPDFMEWWDQNHETYVIKLQAGENAARMMTIHKAKGLEFKVCFIPLLDWSITPAASMAPTLWVETKATPFEDIPYVPIKHSAALVDSNFNTHYWEEEVKSFMDSLNMLYVALTRAGDALIINTAASNKDNYISSILKNYGKQSEFWNDDKQELRIGDISDFSFIAEEGEKDDLNEKLETVDLNYYESHNWQEKLQIKQTTTLSGTNDTLSKVDLGIFVHDVFARLKDLKQLPELFSKLKAENKLMPDDFQKLKYLVEGNLKVGSPLLPWFDTSWQVKTEVPVLLPDGELIRLDRVLINGEEAKILDFKTGIRDKKYEKQVKFYRNSLQKMGYLKVSAFIAYLDPLEIKEVT